MHRVIISEHLTSDLEQAVARCGHDRLFVLTDDVTVDKCLPLISRCPCIGDAGIITVGSTDTHKDMQSLAHVWKQLGDMGATRHSCMINLGGGMVTDLGGFAASTFKRGIRFINIPTTLLSMVDASVGGKTGINFNGLKNEVGVFRDPEFVILDTVFLRTLDAENMLSGYAEMLKHGLISTAEMWRELTAFDIAALTAADGGRADDAPCPDKASDATAAGLLTLQSMVAASVAVKERVVTEDPHEQGLRKALNLGHTIGHAFESFAMRQGRPVLHGYAVAYGIICELYLSCLKTGFPTDIMRRTVQFIRRNYGCMTITCDDYPALRELMTHDKKNTAGTINFTLLGGIGDIRINQTATRNEIYEALDFYREG